MRHHGHSLLFASGGQSDSVSRLLPAFRPSMGQRRCHDPDPRLLCHSSRLSAFGPLRPGTGRGPGAARGGTPGGHRGLHDGQLRPVGASLINRRQDASAPRGGVFLPGLEVADAAGVHENLVECVRLKISGLVPQQA